MTDMSNSTNRSMNGHGDGNEHTNGNENTKGDENRMDELVREISEALTQGEMLPDDRQQAIRKNLSARYEVRIQAETDPIAEEIKQYRSIAEEVDDRYDSYMERAAKRQNDPVKKYGKKNP
ncbi:hypothetical protein [Ferviditalea candida]|uniref:Uncharacterized protein n=1 Tax=Ferviditalea candida TaxID=3108399 RepID=A0ABU5ZF65_9BACL|nr:hypothetical protein [Paenibacillaceae bacterium T2]